MKKICLILFIFISHTCYAQTPSTDDIRLTISPSINQKDSLNQEIITTILLFLKTKDSSYTDNQYWSKSDFKRYIFPYVELASIEKGKLGNHFYQPLLMEIIPTITKNKKIVKLAFVGHNNTTNDNVIKAIFNFVATKENDNIIFSKYLDYVTATWKSISTGSITYKISPNKIINKDDVLKQKKDITTLCKFLSAEPIPITYFSCSSPKEVFELKGFDYHPMMYTDTSGGFSQDKNIVLSGNNSEYYTHEITHLYLAHLFPSINSFLNEGFATYVGGSGKHSYQWQRNRLKFFLKSNTDFQFYEHLEDPYEQLFYEHETPIPYLIGALVCERTLRLYGKVKLFDLFKSNKGILETLRIAGLTKENINIELRKEIDLQQVSTIINYYH